MKSRIVRLIPEIVKFRLFGSLGRREQMYAG